MNLKKCLIALGIIFSVYLLGVNYYLLAHVFGKKWSFGILIPTWRRYKEILNDPLSTSYTRSKFHAEKSDEIKSDYQKMLARSSHADIPSFDVLKAMINEDVFYNSNNSGNSACPYVGLRKHVAKLNLSGHSRDSKCRLKLQTLHDCKESIEYYGKPGEIKETKCSIGRTIEICHIVRLKTVEWFDIVCDTRRCEGKPLQLGLFGSQTGVVDNWTVISDIKRLGQYLRDHVATSKFGASFALLKCEGTNIFQVLSLPMVFKLSESRWKRRKINFNIVVEDSLSRPHFYRTLLKTVSTLRNIIYNQSIPASVLEFEKVQSYGSTTKCNLQRLFSGATYNLQANREMIGLEDFFSLLKESGYSTLFQEDNCWYDKWGTLLDLRYRVGRVDNEKKRRKIWREFVDFLEKTNRSNCIDDFGLSFLSCSVYAYLHVSNAYDARRFPNVCFAGQHFSSFFLNYAKEYVKLNDNTARPFLAYTHVVTSHERSGRRIVNDDVTLSKLLLQAAYLHNTVTIFVSDHGGKSTKFSSYTTQGRREVFQPILFMIIPHKLSDRLEPELKHALVVNQKRLLGLQDLGDALRSYIDPTASALRGLFRPILLNRTCEQLDLDSDVLCLCDNMDKSISNDSQVVEWAADFALGFLNNMIQEQFTAGLKSKHDGEIITDSYGYGACQRYTGLTIDPARHSIAGKRETLALNLFVQPFDRKTKEVFHVKVSFPVEQEDGMILEKITRVSSFNEYEKCADENVDPKLCTCRTSPQRAFKWRQRYIKRTASQQSFWLAPSSLMLDKPCLTIISRSRHYVLPDGTKQNSTSTYEAFNECSYITYNLTIHVRKAKSTRISRKLPHTITILPRTMTFLMTIKNEWKFGRFVPRFSFVKRKLES